MIAIWKVAIDKTIEEIYFLGPEDEYTLL